MSAAEQLKPRAPEVRPDDIPEALRERNQWVMWRYLWGGKKWTKPPCRADGSPASSTDPATWCDFERAMHAYQRGGFDGIGFVVTGHDNFVGIDLDHATESAGSPKPKVSTLLQRFDSYTERTPSGEGFRVWVIGRKPEHAGCKRVNFDGNGSDMEIYGDGRFFTVTGHRITGSAHTIEPRQNALDALCNELWPQTKPKPERTAERTSGDEALSDEELLARARNAKNSGAKFRALFDEGDTSGYGNDQSAADLALCNLLAFWTGREPKQMDRLFRRSKRMRDKWDERRGQLTYGQITIGKAIEDCDTIYTPKATDTGDEIREAWTLTPITLDELHSARLTPRVILRDLLYADVRTRISAGGTGKTTVTLFEAVTLALGRELYGRKPDGTCRTVIVTREDSREILVARLREIMRAMALSPDEVGMVLERVLVIDKSGESFRLSEVVSDVVSPHHGNLQWLVETLTTWAPDWIIFDPLVSFGVGESRVNDAEQGLIEAFRVLRNRLDCCIEGIHHSGKANAREKTLDQYSGRGGSALSDGSRMVVVMQPLDPAEWIKETGTRLDHGETGLVMALPKLSYAKTQDPIFIRRAGYTFSTERVQRRTPEQAARETAEQVLRFIVSELQQDRKYCGKDLENSASKMNLTRQQVRDALTELKVAGRLIYVEVKGKIGSHYAPVTLAEPDGETPEESGDFGGES
jgi:RecA-family ATPase